MDKELAANRRKSLKYFILTMGICLLIGYWGATEYVAYLTDWNPLLGRSFFHMYAPWKFYQWQNDPKIFQLIPDIISQQVKWIYLSGIAGMFVCYLINKNMSVMTSHGSAAWATKEDIDKAGLGEFEEKKKSGKLLGVFPVTKVEKKPKRSGVVCGINPYTHKLMLDDGPAHVLLMAPTRSGKGVGTIIPTGLIWPHSMFFFDVKSELWQATAKYRQEVFGQKVMKFEPLQSDGSSARWNPLAEIDVFTPREINDVQTIVDVLVNPTGAKEGSGDPFWPSAAAALLKGAIIHLLYANYVEKRPLPCLTDVMSLLSPSDKSLGELFNEMRVYPHITLDAFLENKNPLKDIYGEYVRDYRGINKLLQKMDPSEKAVSTIEEARQAVLRHKDNIDWDFGSKLSEDNDDFNDWLEEHPFRVLLTHPKVAEAAANMANNAEQTRASIMSTAQTDLTLYQNPVIQRNTAVSDFCLRDLLDPRQAVSLYLVMATNDVKTLKPLARLFIQLLLGKLIRNIKFSVNQDAKGAGKQRLLLMLDEFPQLGNMQSIELALAVCAGYGIKMCIVAQDVNQLQKEYTKENSIASNCHVHIYFTPNLDSGGGTAKAISESLGKRTISTSSHSDGGGLFKGSNTTSATGRELMTADEISHMDQRKALIFVAGHRPILADKLFFFEHKWFTSKASMGCPMYSDTCTVVASYDDLLALHEAEAKELEASKAAIKEEKAKDKVTDAKNKKAEADHKVLIAQEALEKAKQEYSRTTSEIAKAEINKAELSLRIALNRQSVQEIYITLYELRLNLIHAAIANIQAGQQKKAATPNTDEYKNAQQAVLTTNEFFRDAKVKLDNFAASAEEKVNEIEKQSAVFETKQFFLDTIENLSKAKMDKDSIDKEVESSGKASQNLLDKQKVADVMLQSAVVLMNTAKEEYEEATKCYETLMAIKQKEQEALEAKEENEAKKQNKEVDTDEEETNETEDNGSSAGDAGEKPEGDAPDGRTVPKSDSGHRSDDSRTSSGKGPRNEDIEQIRRQREAARRRNAGGHGGIMHRPVPKSSPEVSEEMRSDEELLRDKKPVSEEVPESNQQENSVVEVEVSAVQEEESPKTVQKLVDKVPDDENIAKEFEHFNDVVKKEHKHSSDNK